MRKQAAPPVDPRLAMIDLALEQMPKSAESEIPPDLTLEQLVTDPKLVGFPASAVQRALLRAADGLHYDDLIPDPNRREFHFGSPAPGPTEKPRIVVLRTGVRSGKSLLAAIAGLLGGILRATFRRPPDLLQGEIPDPRDGLVGVRPGELVRAPIVTPLMKQSRAAFRHFVSNMKASPLLRGLLVKDLDEQALIRRPDGYEVLVEMIAASPSGDNLRSTWLAGVVYDEADFFDSEEAAVNLNDNFDAGVNRLLPGTQAWLPSSPWAEEGPYHKMFMAAFGRPGDTLAFHSDTRGFNPTLDRVLEAKERARDPDKAAREYDGIPLTVNASQFFPEATLAMAIKEDRELLLPPMPGYQHEAGADLGFTKNSSALAIARNNEGVAELAYHDELRPPPGKPLIPSEVCQVFAKTCKAYGALSVRGDLHNRETAVHEMGGLGVEYDAWAPKTEDLLEVFTIVRTRMSEGRCSIPNDPRLIQQFRDVRSQAVPGGKTRIILPKRGRAHGDVLTAVVLALAKVQLEEVDARIIRIKSRRQ